jgi:hypothetical protein
MIKIFIWGGARPGFQPAGKILSNSFLPSATLIQPFQKKHPVPAKTKAPAGGYLALMLSFNVIYGRHAGAPVAAAIDSKASPVE